MVKIRPNSAQNRPIFHRIWPNSLVSRPNSAKIRPKSAEFCQFFSHYDRFLIVQYKGMWQFRLIACLRGGRRAREGGGREGKEERGWEEGEEGGLREEGGKVEG